MTDEYLIAMLRNNVGVSEAACRAAKAAANRIEQLVAEKDAATAAAYERAARICEDRNDEVWDRDTGDKVGLDGAAEKIRALATPDQNAALDRMIAEAVKPYVEALQEIEIEYDPSEGSGNARSMYDIALAAAAKKGGAA